MKHEAVASCCAISHNMEFPESDLNKTLNLEELIQCVSIGKTAIDPESGKCNLSDDQPAEDDSTNSTNVDFDPIKLRSCLGVVCDRVDEKNMKVKKLRTDDTKQDSSLLHHNQKTVEAPTKTDSDFESSFHRLKRKRRLNDEENFCLNKINDKNNKTDESGSLNVVVDPVQETSLVIAKLSGCSNHAATTSSTETSSNHSEPGALLDLQQLTLQEDGGNVVADGKNMTNSSGLSASMATDNQTTIILSPTKHTDDNQATKCKKRKSEKNNDAEPRSLRKRIRKTLPPVKARQTPMGLPKPLRLKKEKFSLEEIYTNKNYSTPVPKTLETIFEYPKEEKDGSVSYSEKRRKQRAMAFYTNPADRPAKKRTKFKKRSTRRNKRDTDVTIDTKLIETLAGIDEHLLIHDLSP